MTVQNWQDEAEVIGALGEEIGEVKNIIIGENDRVQGIIASDGGFWGIGDTRVFVPWDRLRYVPAVDRVYVPLTEDNVEIYETAVVDMLLRSCTGHIRGVDETSSPAPRCGRQQT